MEGLGLGDKTKWSDEVVIMFCRVLSVKGGGVINNIIAIGKPQMKWTSS